MTNLRKHIYNKRTTILVLVALVLSLSSATVETCAATTGDKETATDIKAFPYTRVDFELKGSKCVSCIRKVVKNIRSARGVAKADISIQPPYAGVVIFSRDKTNFAHIEKRMKSEKVEAMNTEQENLKTVPAILIPKSLMKKLKMKDKN